MKFVLAMAWRDSRASRRRLLLFSLSIAAGIAALVALGSGSASLERAVRVQAKGLLGADLVVTTREPASAGLRAFLAERGEVAPSQSFTSMATFPSAGAARLVQVRALQGSFPFYGDFISDPADGVDRLRRGERVALVEPTLLAQFGLRPGDKVRLGRTDFTLAGSIVKLAGESPAVATFAPRVLIPLGALAETGLGGAGALVRHTLAVRLPAGSDANALAGALGGRFPGQRIGVQTAAGRERELGRTLANIYGYLGLAGFVALFLGAIGVASAIHVHVGGKLSNVAVLRCLGASASQSFAIYLVQGIGLGLAGAIVGTALGIGLQEAIPLAFKAWLPFPVVFTVAWIAVVRAAAAGLAICILFALLPLLSVRRVPPLAAIRSAAIADAAGRRFEPARIAIGCLLFAAVALFAYVQTRSRRLGLGFALGLGGGLGGLWLLAAAVRALARRGTPRTLPYVVRQGMANLHRPQNRTVLLLVSLGLGAFLVLTLVLTRATLLSEIADSGGANRPNLLFFDIQDDQMAPLSRLASDAGTPLRVQAPVVTMRIAAVRGRPVEELLRDPADHLPGWALRREYRSTYRGDLSETERVVAGAFVGRTAASSGPVPISVEEGLARDLKLRLGDEIDWDVQGVPVRSRIASIREVQWRRLEPNFFVVFPEGILEAAPKFFLAAARADSPAASARLQRAVAAALPNVSAIDLTQLQETLDSLFSKVAFVVTFMALFTVATGAAVLAGAVAASRYQRRREMVLLRALGASRRQLARIRAVEYASLGLLAALFAIALALAANALLARFFFDAPAGASPGALLAAVVAVPMLTLITGQLADRGMDSAPPLEALRQDE